MMRHPALLLRRKIEREKVSIFNSSGFANSTVDVFVFREAFSCLTFPLRWLIMEDSFTDHFLQGDRDMTELEIMQHAKDYLDKLAKGIDPL